MSKLKDIFNKIGSIGGGLLSGLAGDIPSIVGNIVENADNKRKLEAEIKLRIMEIEAEHRRQILDIEKEIEMAYFEDVKNARALQMEALRQNDIFSKRFVYYYSMAYSVVCVILLGMILFVEIPEKNRTIIDMAFGSMITGGMVQIIAFFFGSSKSSKDKTEMIENLKK